MQVDIKGTDRTHHHQQDPYKQDVGFYHPIHSIVWAFAGLDSLNSYSCHTSQMYILNYKTNFGSASEDWTCVCKVGPGIDELEVQPVELRFATSYLVKQ